PASAPVPGSEPSARQRSWNRPRPAPPRLATLVATARLPPRTPASGSRLRPAAQAARRTGQARSSIHGFHDKDKIILTQQAHMGAIGQIRAGDLPTHAIYH